MNDVLTIVHSPEYANWVFDAGHPTQGRRFTNFAQLLEDWDVPHRVVETRLATDAELRLVHSKRYVDRVRAGFCDEWEGKRPDLGRLARLFAGGTMRAADMVHRGEAKRVFHAPGAKHHAMRSRSSGFCVYADFAMAARWLTTLGHRVAIVDIDGHHGDGTEALTRALPSVLTVSVHEAGIFPGTGLEDCIEQHVHNYPLDHFAGDDELIDSVEAGLSWAAAFEPDIVLLAAGADGHESDPLTSLQYTLGGYVEAAKTVIEFADERCAGRLIVGGAGGYQPDDWTPAIWAAIADVMTGASVAR